MLLPTRARLRAIPPFLPVQFEVLTDRSYRLSAEGCFPMMDCPFHLSGFVRGPQEGYSRTRLEVRDGLALVTYQQ